MDPSDWLPTYPDLPSTRRWPRGPSLASQPPYTTAIFPVPDILAGLTFFPVFPDRVPHRRLVGVGTTAASGAYLPFAIMPLVWQARYPDRVPHHRPPHGPSQVAAPPGAQVVIAQRLAWQARFPDRVWHHRVLQPGGAFAAIDPGVVAGGIPCVDLARDTVSSPALIDETLTAPALLQEGLGTTGFINEDLC